MLGLAILAGGEAMSLRADDVVPPAQYAPLPVAVSSFGAVVSDGWLYVYGGHSAVTHEYSKTAVSGRFDRLRLADGKSWERLADGPGLQGLGLTAHRGKVYRIGGMQPLNDPGKPVDNHSTVECARFDLATKAWQPLPPLPQGRSSHDITVVGDKLFVVGGWSMHDNKGNDWLDTALALDLTADHLAWKKIKQPFERRALAAASYQGKVFVLGGFDQDDEAKLRTDVYDPQTDRWTTGPELPGPSSNGFSPAACTHKGKLYVSVADGTLYRLDDAAAAWQKVAKTTPRVVHRLVSYESQILVIGGASKSGNLDQIEVVKVD
jgi:N-acetylneuraminic acid mutarotase